MNLNKCRKCEKSAEYDSPELLCEDHWIEWWIEGMWKTEDERQQLIIETRDVINGPPLTDEERREIDEKIGIGEMEDEK